ncbi:MAG TPA: cobalamin-binding protein [Firmicutes bacterium]|nr:cobalamin-binding protein [Bacillota bacterium]
MFERRERRLHGARVRCWFTIAMLIVLTVTALGVVVRVPGTVAAGASSAAVEIQDATGTKMVPTTAPRRIVALAPSVTEMLYALGLGPQVVGVAAFSDYPPEAKEKPVVGDAFAINYEALLALRPELVIADENLQAKAIQELRRLGVSVFVVAPHSLEEVLATLTTLGRLTGREAEARQLVAGLEQRIAAVREKTAKLPASRRPRVFVEIWNDPLMTAGPGSFIDELIGLAGGQNIAAGTGQAWPQVNPEWVVAQNPEVLILTLRNRQEVVKRPGWSALAAVRQDRVYEVVPDPLVRTGPRLVDGLEQLARLLHPELFGDGNAPPAQGRAKGTNP